MSLYFNNNNSYNNNNNNINNNIDISEINCVPNDYLIQDTINDTVQSLKFIKMNNQNILASGGWDNSIRLFNVQYQLNSLNNFNNNNNAKSASINANMIATKQLNNPVLGLCWKPNTSNLLISDCEGGLFNYDIQSNNIIQIGKHNAGCKEITYYNENNNSILISGSWDKYLNFWDFRQPNPINSINLQGKIQTVSCSKELLIVGYDALDLAYYDMRKFGLNFQSEITFKSHLKLNTKTVATFPNGDGYVIGSIEGRIAVKYINANKNYRDIKSNILIEPKDFGYRSHRIGSDIYAVNTIAFNYGYNSSFATGGGDGSFAIWDKDSKLKLRVGNFEDRAPITALDYNYSGDMLAYAAGNDWGKGLYSNNYKPRIGIHYLQECERYSNHNQRNNNTYSNLSNYYRK